jgi:hypothetical protein
LKSAVLAAIPAAALCVLAACGEPEAASIQTTLEFGPPAIESGDMNCNVGVDGLPLFARPGFPLLPVYTLKVVLPQGERVASVNADSPRTLAFSLPAPLEWEQPQTPLTWEGPFERLPADAAVFDSDLEYPASRAVHLTTQTMRGYNVAYIRVYPVTYIGSSNEIRWGRRLTVAIETEPDSRLMGRSLMTLRGGAEDRAHIEALADDITYVTSYSCSNHLTLGSSLVNPADTYIYVIITNATLKPVFEDLKALKDSQGLTARIVRIAEITPHYDGVDLQEKIRAFIRDAYLYWGTEYVLLGGDDSVVPHRGMYGEILPYVTDNDVPADIYYAALDGDWNTDGDGRWGEPGEADLIPEVSVGRASVETVQEAANFVSKVIRYQTAPVAGQIKNAHMTGELLYPEPTWGSDSKEEIAGGSSAHGYTTVGIPASWNIIELYDRDLYPGEWDKWDVINNLNSGIHVQNHLGHSNNYYTMKMYAADILSSFTNDGVTNSYFVAFIQGCYTAAFDNKYPDGSYGDDSVGEIFTYIENGAAAWIGTTRYGASAHESTRGAGQYYDRQFFDAVFGEDITTVGGAHDDSKVDNIPYIDFRAIRWEHYSRVLLGEPSMDIWTDTPGNLTVTLPEVLYTSANEVEISVTDGSDPVQGARVSVVSDSAHYCHGFTDAAGVVRLCPLIARPGSLYVAVMAHNFYGAAYTLEVIDATEPLVMLEGVTLDDDGTAPSSGDSDGDADAGETVELSADLKNIGQAAATAVTATLRVDDPYISVGDSVASYGTIGPGSTAGPDAAFVIGIDPDAPDEHEVGLEIHIDYSDTSVTRHHAIALCAPDLGISDVGVGDLLYGDGNGCIGPGETVELGLTVHNGGTGGGGSVSLHVSESDPYTEILSGGTYITSIPAGSSATAAPPCVMSVAPDCPGAHPIDLVIALDFASGRTATCSAVVFTGGSLDDDLEAGQGMWYHEDIVAGFVDQWHLETHRNHTPGGAYSWKFGGPGAERYTHYSHGGLVTPEVCLGPNASLNFWHFIQAELESGDYASDGGLVEISTDGGCTWTQIAPVGGYPYRIYPGTSTPIPPETPCFAWTGGWTQVEFDLSLYEGPARIRFNFGAGEHFDAEEGWYIDDVVVTDDLASVRIDDGDLHVAPDAFALAPVSPNPAARESEIRFASPVRAWVRIEAYEVSGKLVDIIADGVFEPGRHSVRWKCPEDLGPGVYFIRMAAGGLEFTRKAVILK